MAVDKRIEVELALRDTVSLTLKVVADNLDKINKSLAKSSEEKAAGDDTFKKIKEATEGARKTSEEGAKDATAAGERLLPITAGLMRGLLGRALIVGTIGKLTADALLSSTRHRQQMRDMARDTGFTEGFISIIRQAFGRGGVEHEQAMAGIQKMGGLIDEMARGPGSRLSKQLIAAGEGGLALGMEKLAQEGKRDDALTLALRRAEELDKNPEQLIRLAKAFDSAPSFFKDVFKNMRGLEPEFLESIEVAERWGKKLHDVYIGIEKSIKTLENLSIMGANRVLSGDLFKTIWDYLSTARGNPLNPLSNRIPEAELEAFKERNKYTLELLQEILTIFQGVQNKQSIEKREEGGTVLAGREYLVNEAGPETFRSNTGTEQVLFPRNRGPRFFIPKSGGDIFPNTPDPFEYRRQPGDPFMDTGDLLTPFERRFGSWPGLRYDPKQGMVEHPRAGGTPEENWEALNKGLTGPWAGGGLGIPEGSNIPEGQILPETSPEKPSASELRMLERLFESGAMPPSAEDEPWGPRGGEPFEFDPKTGEMGQPVSYRSMIDSELGGGGAGSLGAEVIFKNVPPGVETSAEGDGFDDFTVNKTRQLAGA